MPKNTVFLLTREHAHRRFIPYNRRSVNDCPIWLDQVIIAMPELVPILVAPACIMESACSSVLMPPDAFT